MDKVLSANKKACGAREPKIRLDLEKFFDGISFRQASGGMEMAVQAQGGNQRLVGSDVIAALFGVTARRVQQLTKDGIIIATKEKGANKYDLLPTIQRYIKYLSEKANSKAERTDKEAEDRRLNADADIKEAKAKKAQIELRELEGKMHRSDDVEAAMTDLVFTIRSMVTALPGRLAVDCADAKTPAEVSALIQGETNMVLSRLADYQYDPEEYVKKVREREGWQELANDEPDE